jgi:hypothetical protein
MLLGRAEGAFNSDRDLSRGLSIVFRFRLGRVVISVFVLALFAMVSVALDVSQAATTSRETPISFDIQAQPLASALDRYGDLTGREVFYDTALAAGRRSSGVQGLFTPEAALQTLLAGTGLSARFLADDSFVLLPTPPPPNPQSADRAAPPVVQQRYYALIQASLRDAFCRNSDAQPGRYRVVAVFWIDPSGKVQRYQRLGSAGTSDIDRRIDDTLRGVRLGEPPPPGFAQPVLIMIVPQAPGVIMGCEPRDSGLLPIRAEP